MALKVYGGLTILRGRQVRTIVATSSQKAAAELVGLSLSYLRAYWSQTWNEQELAVALTEPGTVYRIESAGHGFVPVPVSE